MKLWAVEVTPEPFTMCVLAEDLNEAEEVANYYASEESENIGSESEFYCSAVGVNDPPAHRLDELSYSLNADTALEDLTIREWLAKLGASK